MAPELTTTEDLAALERARERFAAAGRTPAPAELEAAAALELALAEGRVDAERAQRALQSIYDGRSSARIGARGRVHVQTHVLGRCMAGIFDLAPRAERGGCACAASAGPTRTSGTHLRRPSASAAASWCSA